jgi:hypothetical protein
VFNNEKRNKIIFGYSMSKETKEKIDDVSYELGINRNEVLDISFYLFYVQLRGEEGGISDELYHEIKNLKEVLNG